MAPTDELIHDLRTEIAQGRVLVILGAGVSMSATEGHEHASWTGLLKSGIERCLALAPLIPEGWEERLRGLIGSGNLDDLLDSAQEIALQLGEPDGGEYKRWLRETVGSLPLLDRTVLEALRDLPVTLATTNYDGLLEEVTGLKPVTWRDGTNVERVLRGKDQGIVHFHGFWGDSESVILSRRSYAEIRRSAHTQTMLQALRSLRTFLFVGCGDGLDDPNFGAFRLWSREIFRTSETRHFRLCRTGEVLTVQALHPPEERIFAVPYGAEHDCLGPFLRTLAPALIARVSASLVTPADHGMPIEARDLPEPVKVVHHPRDFAPLVPSRPTKTGRAPTRWARLLPIFIIATLVAICGGLWWAVSPHPEPASSVAPSQQVEVSVRPSLAVMTFENRSGDENLDWLSTALAEAVSAKLGITGDIRAVQRREVSLAETDLLLVPHASASPRDFKRIRGLLGVDFVLRGDYQRGSATSPVRLALRLYNAADGHMVAQTWGEGDVSTWLDLADRSTGDLPGSSLRHELKRPPLTPAQEVSLRALFPISPSAAKLYAQGLDRYNHFDILGASDFFGRSTKLEPHPLVLAALADTLVFLGRSQEGKEAIQAAVQVERERRNTSRALPERYQREIEIIQRKVAFDEAGVADQVQALFHEFFGDDLSYGLLAAQALIDAGSPELAETLLKELRRLPLADNHPRVELMEADALFVQQLYEPAQAIARRAIAKAKALGAVRQEAQARLLLASILSLMEDGGGEAESQFRQAGEGFEQTHDRRGVAQCLEHAASFYESFDLLLAENLFRLAIGHYEALGDQRDKGLALFGLSAVLTEAERPSEAEKSAREAAALASPLEEGLEPFREGFQAYLAGQLTRAKGHFETAKAIFDLTKQRDNSGITLTNLGEIELMRGRLARAEDLHRQAQEFHEGVVKSKAVPYDMVCRGRVNAVAGEYIAARRWYDQALHTLEKSKEGTKDVAWGEALLSIAEVELLTGHAKKSEESVQAVLDQPVVGLDSVQSRALSLRVRRLLGEDKTEAAEVAAKAALKLAPGDFRAIREAEIASARVLAARGEINLALEKLDKIAAESAKRGQVIYEFESLLAAGEIELEDGRGRHRLEALRNRAAGLHFGQIMKRVASALEE